MTIGRDRFGLGGLRWVALPGFGDVGWSCTGRETGKGLKDGQNSRHAALVMGDVILL